ncbi:Protein of unknown function [Gryllus bimaculatus]|nr:Protein of unknown function [Gryllus bimaculatus]
MERSHGTNESQLRTRQLSGTDEWTKDDEDDQERVGTVDTRTPKLNLPQSENKCAINIGEIQLTVVHDVSEVHQHQLFYESIVNSSAQVVRSDAIKRSCSNIQALRCRTSASRPPRLSGGAHSWRDSPRCRQGRARPGSV